jgi:DNA-directed RNA polymerase beta subunit
LALKLGAFIDATPFTTTDSLPTLKQIMMENGFEPYGTETLYNGQTGEMMEMEIFMGATYYIRSKLMVEDKINYRDTGAKTLLTHQPLEGRSAGGGLRIGEMERDALIAHGVSGFIEESFMKRSDEHEVIFQKETGLLDSTGEGEVGVLRMPYAMSLYVKELESMHIRTNIVGV